MMWKKSLFALLCASPFVLAENVWAENPPSAPVKTWTESELQQQLAVQKQQFQTALAQREKQRELFVAADSLLSTAKAQGKLPAPTQALIERIIAQLDGYPLQNVLRADLQKARLAANLATPEEINAFIAQNPTSSEAKRLQQLPFERLFSEQKYAELTAYAQTVAPMGVENQCRLFAAKFQLLAEQHQPNPEAEQAGNTAKALSPELSALLSEFSAFWLENDLTSECNAIEAFWRDQGLKTAEIVKARAVKLFEKNAKASLANLQNDELAEWLAAVQKLLDDPRDLQNFAENQPLAEANKALMIQAFPRFVRTLSENSANADFSPYQKWAEKFQLAENEVSEWKVRFIGRLFDNENPRFQQWRDEQLKALKNDNLIERRLRLAIAQKSALQPWLDLLSAEGKNKLEWRYWQAKADPKQREKLLTALAQERGFYPMLAAQQLGKNYQYPSIQPKETVTGNEPELTEIAEYRALKRLGTAKVKWVEWLKTLPFEKQVALAAYANAQGWYDLGVEATIQAKAWDYVEQRLPKAYADWFALHLSDKPIRQSFAMAIARQESAWNAQVRSHANAVGLMQMLPSTAKATADTMGLLYRAESDLLDPFKNIMLGTAHLTELNQKYPNNRILMASAYNAGASRADKWLERANGKLAMDEFIASIPFLETRGYVQNVLAYDYYYQHILGEKTPQMFTPEELRTY